MDDDTVEIDGMAYARIYGAELEPGMVNAWGEKVESVERIRDDVVLVKYDSGMGEFWPAAATKLIDVTTITAED